MGPVNVAKGFETNALQNLAEHDAFLEVIKRENVRSYLEIGSRWGGSLWRVARAMPVGSLVATIDVPHDPPGRESLGACFAALRELGYDVRYYFGDSTSPGAVAFAESLGPLDCVFIDANHALPFVTKDWENYGSMARMVVFHDANHTHPVKPGKNPIEVRKLWLELRARYRHEEIMLEAKHNGIGILWPKEGAL